MMICRLLARVFAATAQAAPLSLATAIVAQFAKIPDVQDGLHTLILHLCTHTMRVFELQLLDLPDVAEEFSRLITRVRNSSKFSQKSSKFDFVDSGVVDLEFRRLLAGLETVMKQAYVGS